MKCLQAVLSDFDILWNNKERMDAENITTPCKWMDYKQKIFHNIQSNLDSQKVNKILFL